MLLNLVFIFTLIKVLKIVLICAKNIAQVYSRRSGIHSIDLICVCVEQVENERVDKKKKEKMEGKMDALMCCLENESIVMNVRRTINTKMMDLADRQRAKRHRLARTARSARDCPDSALYQVPSTHFLSAVWLSLSFSLLPQTHNLPRL
ncbi:unnamed protein product [Citrullus colocynthis]|uniref:Uncharacterized protein n=1 Tax=Citrullus colocynthis TaxID=252529 RepID=A0ABP0ZCI1_9ROSI